MQKGLVTERTIKRLLGEKKEKEDSNYLMPNLKNLRLFCLI